eukprot:gene9657-6909_t
MPSFPPQYRATKREEEAAVLIQKTFRGSLGRAVFAKELLQKERGKRRNGKRTSSSKPALTFAPTGDVVVVQAVKKAPVRLAAHASAPIVINSGPSTFQESRGSYGRVTSELTEESYNDLNASVDSLQRDSSPTLRQRALQLSGIVEVDEDVVRDSLSGTLRQPIAAHTAMQRRTRLVAHEDADGVADSLDLGRQTDRLSAAGTVPWPQHHGRSQPLRPGSAAKDSTPSPRHVPQDTDEDERLEDSLEYRLLMRDVLATPRAVVAPSNTPAKTQLAPPPLSQPPTLRPANHIEVLTPPKGSARVPPVVTPQRPAAQPKSTATAAAAAAVVDVKGAAESKGASSAPQAAAAAGSRIPLRQAPRAAPLQPRTQLITAAMAAEKGGPPEDADASGDVPNAQPKADAQLAPPAKRGPPGVRDLLQQVPMEAPPAAAATKSAAPGDRLAQLQRLYAEDVGSAFRAQPQPSPAQSPVRSSASRLDAVNLALMGLQHSPSRRQPPPDADRDADESLRPSRVDDDVSVLTDASPFRRRRAPRGAPPQQPQPQPRATSAARRGSGAAEAAVVRAPRRISFSEEVQRQSPRVADDASSAASVEGYAARHGGGAPKAAASKPPRAAAQPPPAAVRRGGGARHGAGAAPKATAAPLRSQELERQLLAEIADLTRKQQQLQDAQQSLAEAASPAKAAPQAAAAAAGAGGERKAQSAPRARPAAPAVDAEKAKEKKAFGWGARDFRAAPPAAAQRVAARDRAAVARGRAARRGPRRAAAANDDASSARGYEQQYSVRQDHLALPHAHLDAAPGYLQDFARRKQQQQRSTSAQRGAASRRVALDGGDERSYHSAQSAASQKKTRAESASLPPLLPLLPHRNLAAAPPAGPFAHPFDPPSRRVSSRHSTRSAPS